MLLQKIGAFFRLVRYPNLIFIALTQSLFYFIIEQSIFSEIEYATGSLLGTNDFFLLLLSSVAIAAGGYIINDYFDMDIDNVNKPHKLVIGKLISRRWAMLFHMLLSLIGLFLTAVVALHLNNIMLLVFNFVSVVLLLFYSTTFKKRLLVGNVIISLLTAWVVGVLFIAEIKFSDADYMLKNLAVIERLYKFTLIYAGFAFIVSLVREVVKDLEDIIGDKKYGCTTMPIVWGVNASKIYASIWLVVLIGALGAIFFYTIINTWNGLIPVLVIVLLSFLIFILFQIKKASTSKDFGKISSQVKLLMLIGILSMLLFI
jgi:4-hydroxybenzoate polyprenyltransferase